MKMKTKLNRLKRNIHKAPLSAYVVFSLAMIIIFSIVMIAIFCVKGEVPDTLITCWYSAFGGECLMCALVKIFKLKEENNDE